MYIFKGVCLWPVKTHVTHTHIQRHTCFLHRTSLPHQTAVSYSQGCPGNVAMEKSLGNFHVPEGFCVELIQRRARLLQLSQNQSQRPRRHWEAKEGGRIYGKPLGRHSSLVYLYLHLRRSAPSSLPPKKRGEAWLNIARVEMGAKQKNLEEER